jgi:UDP-N-acetylglucosamine 4,6-dehydratase
VIYAFQNGKPGDIFVQKAPAATIETLSLAIKRLLKAENPLVAIGTRHGEKLYETLLARDEMARADNLGDYFRIPADVRDLNYASYFTEGKPEVSLLQDYNSHNTRRLDMDGMMELLLKLECVQRAMQGEQIEL